MNFTPRPHQQKIIDHIKANDEAMVVAGMGLGKTSSTLQAINDLLIEEGLRGVLIVAPLRVVKLTWTNEKDKWDEFSHINMVSLRTAEGKRAWEKGSADVYLINYEQLQQFATKYLKGKDDLPIDMIVWDEITMAKNPSSKRIKAVFPHRSKIKRHVGLTGTPSPNGYLDLFGQYKILDGGKTLGITYSKFRNKYFESDYMGYSWTLRLGSDKAIQNLIEPSTIVLKSEDYLDIPDVVLVDHEVTLKPDIKKQYKTFQKELLMEFEDGDVEAMNAAVLANKLLQFTSGAIYDTERVSHHLHDEKIKALHKIRANHEPTLVIYYFQHERDRILAEFPDAQQFDEADMDKWNRREIPMWIANAKSIGHGLNLQEGSHHMVWFTLTYSRELYDQTNARLARTGQTEITHIHRIICKESIDEAVVESLRSKGDTQSGLMDAIDNLKKLES